MTDLSGREFERILIIKPSSPGDIIHALPIVRAIRRRYPDAHLAWLIATAFTNLMEADPAIDEIIPFDRKRFGRLGRSWRVTRDFIRFARDLRQKRFDLVVDLQGLFRSGFLSRASGAETRVGFRQSREFAWIFYTDRLARFSADTHAADRNLAVASLLGIDDVPPDFSVSMTDEDRRAADALITDAGINGPRFAVLVPATRWETKTWPAERYGELARRLKAMHGLPSILVGGPDDIELGRTAAKASHGNAINLCGRTTLRQLAALIERAAVVVTADSTPMHLAAAQGRPLVALFGPTSPHRTGPYGRTDDVLRLDLACSPCYYRRLSQCPYEHACMRDLSVEQVVTAVSQRIARAPTAPRAKPSAG